MGTLRAPFVLLAALLLATAGCVTEAPPPLPPSLLAAAGSHVYHRPAPEVLAAVRAELVAEGYVVEPVSDDGLVRTGWKMLIDGREFATFRDRYVVLVKRLTREHCRVEAVRITMSTLGADIGRSYKIGVPAEVSDRTPSFTIYGEGPQRAAVPRGVGRDLAFEWRLLARVEPDRAAPR